MKPQSFAYAAPDTVEHAVTLLAEHGDEAKVLAGGQSLVPMMALRLARPALLVDINRIPALADVGVEGNGTAELRVGATVRHRRFDRPVVAGPLGRLLAAAAHHIGHPPIRNRGTMVGSLAHADPRAEWPLLAVALEATVVASSHRGERRVAAADFFDAPFAPALDPTELITEVRWPVPGPGTGAGFAELARTSGAFLEAAAVALVVLADGVVTGCRLAVAGATGRAVRLAALEAAAVGGPPDRRALARLAAGAPDALPEPAAGRGPDAATGYPADVLPALCARALTAAASDAGWTWS